MAETHSRLGLIDFAAALTILFITLKTIGVIGWSWPWVLSPLWITPTIAASAAASAATADGVEALVKRRARRRNRG